MRIFDGRRIICNGYYDMEFFTIKTHIITVLMNGIYITWNVVKQKMGFFWEK